MGRLVQILLIVNILFFQLPVEGKNRVVISPDNNIQKQLKTNNTTYVIKKTIDLRGESIIVPDGSELVFKRKGFIRNGIIIGNNTTLKGHVKLGCELKGGFSNEEIPVSWLLVSDRQVLSQQIASIFNLERPCVLKIDQDIVMDGTRKDVNYVSFSGSKTIRNSCWYKVKGDVRLQGVSFTDFVTYRELFLDMRGLTGPVKVDISDVKFDGNWNVSRFIYCPYQKLDKQSVLNITSSVFTRVNNYVIQFKPSCTGIISRNRIENIGTDKFSNVVGFHLGESDDEKGKFSAKSFEIYDNEFRDFKVPYNDKDDGREVHALLIYGHNNIVRGNRVVNFYPAQGDQGDIGRDSEGIYLKGGDNVVENNYLENCVGSGPDGAITIKTSYKNNRIAGNIIRHQYGIGIQCYTPNSVIKNNKIYSEEIAEAGLAMLVNVGSEIAGNEFFATDGKAYHSAIAMTSCEGIKILGNQFYNTSGILTTYGCKGNITFEDNQIELKEKIYGTNTYYTAPFELHDDTAKYVVKKNSFAMVGVRTSQLIETPEGFQGKVVLKENELEVEDSKEVQSAMTYLVRNVKSLTVEQNTEKSKVKRIKTVSNLNRKLTLGNK